MMLSTAARHARPAADFWVHPPPRSHTVQFYEDDAFLVDAVCRFFAAGLSAGDRVLAIATEAHLRAITERLGSLGHPIGPAIESGCIALIDTETLLARVMVNGRPDESRFREAVSSAFETLGSQSPVGAGETAPRIRAYGELVDVLARRGDFATLIRLEELWNEASEQHACSLLCAYDLASFREPSREAEFRAICSLHGHVLPTERFSALPDESARLWEVTRLQQQAAALQHEREERAKLEAALHNAQQAHAAIAEELRLMVLREREARARAEASHAFKEVFLGMLGHDLRNPLNAILTTARLMTMQKDHDSDTQKKIARVVSSGERMHRMIEQILDATRARLTAGISVSLTEPRDIVPFVAEVVEELRAAYPERSFQLHAPLPCIARIDLERFAQVLQNLLENAVAHGDPARPISVAAVFDDATVCVSVHNYGQPIDAQRLALLFDPFARGGRPQGRSAGLGLGLYISRHVVRSHGGNMTVESSEQAGTRFEIRLPGP